MAENQENNEVKIESMDDYKDMINASFKRIREGDMLTGTVIGLSETEVNVDLNYYTEGIIYADAFSNDPDFSIFRDVNIGDTITATVIKVDDGNGHIVLSKKEANDILVFDKLNEYIANRTLLHLKVKSAVNGGVIVYVEGMRGFIPASKLDVTYVEDTEEWIGKTVDCMVISAEPDTKRVVLSAKEVALEKAMQERSSKVSAMQVGYVTEGVVESLKPYGAFVNIGNGLSGLVHISEICDKRIKSPASVLKEGEHVNVKVISIKDGKLSLSIKALNDVASSETYEEEFEYEEQEEASTSLGSLLKNLKL